MVTRPAVTTIEWAFILWCAGQPLAGQERDPRIFVADKRGNNVQLLVEIPDAAYTGSPHWSPDGKIILVNAMLQSRRWELSRLYACAVGGPFNGNVVELGYGGCARFSPDMRQIAFHVRSGNPDQLEPGIWIMRDDGSERRRLCDGTRPRWTTDGKSLVFVGRKNPVQTLEFISADGTGQRTIVEHPLIAGASVSPDGKDMCYIAYAGEPYKGALYRVPLAGGAKTREIFHGELGWDPAWSPDGRQIMFWLLEPGGERHLAVIDADGEGPPQKLANQQGTHYNTDAEWSPDGQRIVFCSDRDVPAK